jgi:transcriptional regulator with XRE-family HTH domain
MTILELRKERGESQAEFGLSLGLNASKVSEIETGLRPVSLRVALKIEELSILDGVPRIDAAALNDDVARARAS